MDTGGTPGFKQGFGNSSVVLDFAPPMSEAAMKKNHAIPDHDGSDSPGIGPPKKKRQLSPEPRVSPGVAVVEPTTGSTESSPVPTPTPATAPSKGDTTGESNDRTSKDYYFDSYSHHAIRKWFGGSTRQFLR